MLISSSGAARKTFDGFSSPVNRNDLRDPVERISLAVAMWSPVPLMTSSHEGRYRRVRTTTSTGRRSDPLKG